MNIFTHKRLSMIQKAIACLSLGILISGCGISNITTLSNRLVGSDGQLFTLDEIQEIANDPMLSEAEKRAALRVLGLQDEKIIDVLLQL